MSTKHTPGPWHGETITGRHKVWADRGLNEDQAVIATVDTSANARLIAAAPELLEALNGFEPVDVVNFARWMERYQVVMNNARAAIAKATGQCS